MAAIAVWIAFFINRRQNALLEQRIAGMLPLAHELNIDTDSKIAIVSLDQLWYDENRWDIYLPEGAEYRLCMATRGIGENGLAPVSKSKLIQAGKHRIGLEPKRRRDDWQVTVGLDDTDLLAIDEPKEWGDVSGSTGGSEFSISQQLAVDQPVVLYRRRFMRKALTGEWTTPIGPADGILLWIESVARTVAKP